MANVFWDKKGVVLLIKFMPVATTTNAASYCETLKKLCKSHTKQKKKNADELDLSPARQRSAPRCQT